MEKTATTTAKKCTTIKQIESEQEQKREREATMIVDWGKMEREKTGTRAITIIMEQMAAMTMLTAMAT